MSQPELTAVLAQAVQDMLSLLQEGSAESSGWRRFLGSWMGFRDWRVLIRVSVSLAVAIGLASAIAFHPFGFRRAQDPEDFERPRTLLLYAVVGALVAEIVTVSPPMALVVFGIGGLLRFRTDAGAASDTGRVILVTIVGIATGLGLFPYAVLATASGWLLIFVLERRRLYRVVLDDVDRNGLDEVLQGLEQTLRRIGCRKISRFRSRLKGEGVLVVRAGRGLTDEAFEDALVAFRHEHACELRWKPI